MFDSQLARVACFDRVYLSEATSPPMNKRAIIIACGDLLYVSAQLVFGLMLGAETER
jgi:hypothetical protein